MFSPLVLHSIRAATRNSVTLGYDIRLAGLWQRAELYTCCYLFNLQLHMKHLKLSHSSSVNWEHKINSIPLYCSATADRQTSLGQGPEGQYPQYLQLTSGGRRNFRRKFAAAIQNVLSYLHQLALLSLEKLSWVPMAMPFRHAPEVLTMCSHRGGVTSPWLLWCVLYSKVHPRGKKSGNHLTS